MPNGSLRQSPDQDGGVADGEEDTDEDGAVDPGEKDPLAGWHDPCAGKAPLEVTGLKLYVQGDSDVKVSWDGTAGSDPCAYYEVWVSTAPRLDSFGSFALAQGGLGSPGWTDTGILRDGKLRAYLVRAVSVFAGGGPFGAYGQ